MPEIEKVNVYLQAWIPVMNRRAKIMKSALSSLPSCQPHCVEGYHDWVVASRELEAAEKLVRESERKLKSASRRIRKYVSNEWSPSEIPKGTWDLLNVW